MVARRVRSPYSGAARERGADDRSPDPGANEQGEGHGDECSQHSGGGRGEDNGDRGDRRRGRQALSRRALPPRRKPVTAGTGHAERAVDGDAAAGGGSPSRRRADRPVVACRRPRTRLRADRATEAAGTAEAAGRRRGSPKAKGEHDSARCPARARRARPRRPRGPHPRPAVRRSVAAF